MGLDPYQLTDAAFLRYLGRLQHKRKLLRRVIPKLALNHLPGPVAAFVRASFPWTVNEYPGSYALLANIMDVHPDTASKYRREGPSIPAIARVKEHARAKARELEAIANELEHMETVARANASPVRGWWRVDLKGRDATRAASDAAQKKRARRKPRPSQSSTSD